MATMREMYCITSAAVYDLANELKWVCKNYNEAKKIRSSIFAEQLYWEIAGWQKALNALGIKMDITWKIGEDDTIDYFELDLLSNDIFFVD